MKGEETCSPCPFREALASLRAATPQGTDPLAVAALADPDTVKQIGHEVRLLFQLNVGREVLLPPWQILSPLF